MRTRTIAAYCAVFTLLAALVLLSAASDSEAAHSNPRSIGPIVVQDTPQGVGVNSVTNRIFVANHESDNVSVIDGDTKAIIATVPVDPRPMGVAVDETRNLIYVTSWGSDATPKGSLNVINGADNRRFATLPLVDGEGNPQQTPRGVAVNPVTNRIYVGNDFSGTVSIIDGDTLLILKTIPNLDFPWGVAVNTVTNKIYVANYVKTTVTVIDANNNDATTPIDLNCPGQNCSPKDLAVDPSTNRIYVANQDTNNVQVIDGNTNSVIATIPVGSQPRGVGLNPNTNRLYVANFNSDNVHVIDTITNAVIGSVPVGDRPDDVDVNTTTDRVYVANGHDDTVAVIEDDADADDSPDSADPCPANPDCDGDSNLPPDYTDCQGQCPGGYFRDGAEIYIGTAPTDRCADTTAANDEADDKWPPDMNDNRVISISDVLTWKVHKGHSDASLTDPGPDGHFDRRYDLDVDGLADGVPNVKSSDLDVLAAYFGTTCSP